jgi:hypothetical protein
VARLHLSNAEAEALTVWIAHRVGRAQTLAGDRGAYGRLEHVARHWLSEGQRSALLAWLMRRIALGQPRYRRIRAGDAFSEPPHWGTAAPRPPWGPPVAPKSARHYPHFLSPPGEVSLF